MENSIPLSLDWSNSNVSLSTFYQICGMALLPRTLLFVEKRNSMTKLKHCFYLTFHPQLYATDYYALLACLTPNPSSNYLKKVIKSGLFSVNIATILYMSSLCIFIVTLIAMFLFSINPSISSTPDRHPLHIAVHITLYLSFFLVCVP